MFFSSLAQSAGVEIAIDFQVYRSSGFNYRANDTDRLYLSNFEAVGVPANDDLGAWENESVVSSECALWTCVQSFELRQQNSDQTSKIREEFSKIQFNTRLKSIGTEGDRHYNIKFDPLPPSMNSPAGINFTVNNNAAFAFQSYFSTVFNGTLFKERNFHEPSSDVIQAPWNASADLDAWTKNIAASMTNVVRTTIPAHSPQFDGTGYQLGYDVRCAW